MAHNSCESQTCRWSEHFLLKGIETLICQMLIVNTCMPPAFEVTGSSALAIKYLLEFLFLQMWINAAFTHKRFIPLITVISYQYLQRLLSDHVILSLSFFGSWYHIIDDWKCLLWIWSSFSKASMTSKIVYSDLVLLFYTFVSRTY